MGAKDHSDFETLIPGTHPPDVEARILNFMEENAAKKADQGEWMEAYCILEKIYSYKRKALGDHHSDVAKTLYRMGVVLMNLGNLDDAYSCFEDGVRILYPKRKTESNIDLASLFHQLGAINYKNGKYQKAIYYTKLAQQVEIHVLGHTAKKTKSKLLSLQRRLLQDEIDRTRSKATN